MTRPLTTLLVALLVFGILPGVALEAAGSPFTTPAATAAMLP